MCRVLLKTKNSLGAKTARAACLPLERFSSLGVREIWRWFYEKFGRRPNHASGIHAARAVVYSQEKNYKTQKYDHLCWTMKVASSLSLVWLSILTLVSSSLWHPVSRLVKDQTTLTQAIDCPGLVRVFWMASSHSCDYWIDGLGWLRCTIVRFSRYLESVDDKQVWGSCRGLHEWLWVLSSFLLSSILRLLCCIEDNAWFKYGGELDSLSCFSFIVRAFFGFIDSLIHLL